MSDKPEDRLIEGTAASGDEDPKIFVVVNGKRFPRPALETYFAAVSDDYSKPNSCGCHPVVGSFCSCNKVCNCIPVCGCVGHTTCSCVGHTSRSGGGCRCAPVH